MKTRLMKTLILTIAFFILSTSAAWSQCSMPTDTFFITPNPPALEAGQTTYVSAIGSSTWPTAVPSRFRVSLDGEPIPVLSYTDSGLTAQVPSSVQAGVHVLSVCVVDGPWSERTIEIEEHQDTLDTGIDKTDPDPRTQNGPRQDLSSGSRRISRTGSRTYPNGGYGGSLSCDERHVIDGQFTEHEGHQREWSGITPMIGRFSNLYLDYCPDTKVMYLMNDWLIGSGEYQSNCYNLFGFTTGNGREVWLVKVTHDTLRPVIVELNGEDVTDDTTLVMGGAFSIGASPSDTTPHTMYEFGVRVSSGLFFMPRGDDPVQYVPSTTTSLECDKDGQPGYGLIREPYVRLAWFSNDGVSVQQAQRYIPTSGVVGLETEPNNISGEFGGDTITYRSGSQPPVGNTCNGVINVDGQLTDVEWTGVLPASGRYSDMYAKYCNGTLHILNDWVHATGMPDNRTCYNLFELYTGNGAEHWGIWVWQDPTRKPTVYRNGINVSDDTTIVQAGEAGWGTSPRKAEPHAIYEFTISAMEGGFAMMFADPGPSSYCSLVPNNVNEEAGSTPVPRIYPNPSSGRTVTVDGLSEGDRILIYDLSGRQALLSTIAGGPAATITLPSTLAIGRYSVRIVRNDRVYELPLLLFE